MADREGDEQPRGVPSVGEIRDDVRTTDDIQDASRVITPTQERNAGQGAARRRGAQAGPEPPPEDEEVNPIGSYETWDQSGQGLDAVGSGMTGDAGSVGLTGTGFEDDPEL